MGTASKAGRGGRRGRAVIRVSTVAAAATFGLPLSSLALAGTVLASTTTDQSATGSNPFLFVAALVGAGIAAVWLLKPSGSSRPKRGRDAGKESRHERLRR